VRRAALAFALVLLLSGVSASASASTLGLRFEGGSILPYEALEETGNGAQLLLTLELDQLQLGLGAGVAMPAAHAEASMPLGQLTCQWHPLKGGPWSSSSRLSPYVSLGVGLAGPSEEPDDDGLGAGSEELVRWVRGRPQFLGMLGLGMSFGEAEGLYVSAEARAVNLTHFATTVGVGIHF